MDEGEAVCTNMDEDMQKDNVAAFAGSKPHYELLDGLRGVAALMVMWFHVFEAFATSPVDQRVNHGYMAVDFFFILSGFVIGYAYDDCWGKGMTVKGFFRRRLIRLHPMVIVGAVLGAVAFCVQGCEKWDGTAVPLAAVGLALLLNLFLLPVVPGTMPEVRGNNEMYPLNGPSWSLFFEYIGNILYGLFVRRLRTVALAVLVGVAGAGLAVFAIGNFSGAGHLGVGWSMIDYNLLGGFLRVAFSMSAGLLLSRVFKPMRIRGAFWLCSAGVVVLLAMPHVGGEERLWLNGVYDAVCVLLLFPLLVYMGASGKATDPVTSKVCKFLGDISYPLYIVHYPFMYLYYSWVWKNGLTFRESLPGVAAVFVVSILLAYLFLKVYDEPVRRWLTARSGRKRQVGA